VAEHIDTDAVRRLHTEAPVFWSGEALALCDEVDRLRVVRDAAQRVVNGDWRDDDLDVWDALGMIRAALEADRG
jgi:hypothetical protein